MPGEINSVLYVVHRLSEQSMTLLFGVMHCALGVV